MLAAVKEKFDARVLTHRRKVQARNQLDEVRPDLLEASYEFLEYLRKPKEGLIDARRNMYKKISSIEAKFYLGYLIVPEKYWTVFEAYAVQNMVLNYKDGKDEISVELKQDAEKQYEYPSAKLKKKRFNVRIAMDKRIRSELKQMSDVLQKIAKIR